MKVPSIIDSHRLVTLAQKVRKKGVFLRICLICARAVYVSCKISKISKVPDHPCKSESISFEFCENRSETLGGDA